MEANLTRHDLYVADEMFLTGTAAEVIPVTKADERVIGTGKPGPVTTALRAAFTKAVRE
jgi:branched-chain amino acid aminotransferase